MYTPTRDEIAKRMNERDQHGNRAPFLGRGDFVLEIQKMTKKTEKTEYFDKEGKPVEREINRMLYAKVLETNCPGNPPGTSCAVYFERGRTGWEGENDEKDLWNLFITILECVGIKPMGKCEDPAVLDKVAELWPEFLSDETFAEGVKIAVQTRPSKKREGDPKAFLYKNWSAIPGQGK